MITAAVGAVCLILYGIEYLLAVRYRGHWFDHDMDDLGPLDRHGSDSKGVINSTLHLRASEKGSP